MSQRAVVVALMLLCALSCGGDGGGPRLVPGEAELRAEYGIPAAARRVMVVSQSSHLDLNFIDTYDGYWESSVRSVLETALDLLDREPRYRYSVAEVAFLRRYWDEVPEDRERLRRHVASGALRIVGGGISSPDSLLPTGESLLRDWLRGMRWVEQHLGVTPTAAWQPDSFGHAPTLPSLLDHMGFESVGFFRVDGATAETLTDVGAADFLWRSADGAELLAHWMPWGYSQGDVLDFDSDVWAMSGLGIDWNVSEFVVPEITNDRFQTFIDQLEDLRRTPYLFLPIGVDFSWPKPELLGYIDRWNRERYRSTGVWIVAATFEDYVRLLVPHRGELPRFDFDMSPYWTGFYSTRIGLKQRVRRAHEALIAAEVIATVVAEASGTSYPRDAIDRGWDNSAFMNHHDAITGTTTVESWQEDLIPWSTAALESGETALHLALADLAAVVDTSHIDGDRALVLFNRSAHERSDVVELEVELPSGAAHGLALTDPGGEAIALQLLDTRRAPDGSLEHARLLFRSPPLPSVGHLTLALHFLDDGETAAPSPGTFRSPTVELREHSVVLANGLVTATLDATLGHCLTSVRFADGEELLAGPSNDVVTLLDLGGAYRLGSEIDRAFLERASSCAAGTRTTVQVLEAGPVRVAVRVVTEGDPARTERIVRLAAGSERLDLETTVAAPGLTSVLVRFRTRFEGEELTTSIPHGAVKRARAKLFDPTFWPVTAWIDLAAPQGTGGFWMSAEGSRGWHVASEGTVEAMLSRNVSTEGLGPAGPDPEARTTRMALGRRPGRDWLAGRTQRLGQAAHRPIQAVVTELHAGELPATRSWLRVDRGDVELAALKLAEGSGTDPVLRLVRYGEAAGPVRVEISFAPGHTPHAASGLELATAPLPGTPGSFDLEMPRLLQTVRLVRTPSS